MLSKLSNRKVILAFFLTIVLLLQISNPASASSFSNREGLDDNQDWLYFMYANQEGCFFLQPIYDVENVIFVDDHKACKDANHGSKFIGTFENEELWDFVSIEKYAPKKKIKKLLKKLNSK